MSNELRRKDGAWIVEDKRYILKRQTGAFKGLWTVEQPHGKSTYVSHRLESVAAMMAVVIDRPQPGLDHLFRGENYNICYDSAYSGLDAGYEYTHRCNYAGGLYYFELLHLLLRIPYRTVERERVYVNEAYCHFISDATPEKLRCGMLLLNRSVWVLGYEPMHLQTLECGPLARHSWRHRLDPRGLTTDQIREYPHLNSAT